MIVLVATDVALMRIVQLTGINVSGANSCAGADTANQQACNLLLRPTVLRPNLLTWMMRLMPTSCRSAAETSRRPRGWADVPIRLET